MSKHLSLNDRIIIKENLDNNISISLIAKKLSKATSTISREIVKNSTIVEKGAYGKPFNNCVHRKNCHIYGLCKTFDSICDKKCSTCKQCNDVCHEYSKEVCSNLNSSPYVCNGCPNIKSCTLEKLIYDPSYAQKKYETTLKESREGFNLTEEELNQIDNFVSPYIKNGHSIYHITHNVRSEIPCSDSTIFRLINAGLLSCKNIDLPRKVRFKPRKGKKPQLKVDKKCTVNRKYEDYIKYIEENPDLQATQIDSVEGKKGEKVLLTAILPNINFMFAFIRDANNSKSVKECFDYLYDILSKDIYSKMFGLLLGDNGTEFSDPYNIEFASDNKRRSRLFYCHPSSPYEKGKVENNHEFLRKIIPKGTSINFLTQDKVNLMLSHINSYGRNQFNGLSPTDLFIQIYGEDVLQLLGQQRIKSGEIILTPNLFSKKGN